MHGRNTQTLREVKSLTIENNTQFHDLDKRSRSPKTGTKFTAQWRFDNHHARFEGWEKACTGLTFSWCVLKNLRAFDPRPLALPPPGRSWTLTWNCTRKIMLWTRPSTLYNYLSVQNIRNVEGVPRQPVILWPEQVIINPLHKFYSSLTHILAPPMHVSNTNLPQVHSSCPFFYLVHSCLLGWQWHRFLAPCGHKNDGTFKPPR